MNLNEDESVMIFRSVFSGELSPIVNFPKFMLCPDFRFAVSLRVLSERRKEIIGSP